MTTLYRRLADHYLSAIRAGTLPPGSRMPSLRALMRAHGASLTTVLQACRHLEAQGWLDARPRSGYFVRQPRRVALLPATEPQTLLPDPADYDGIHPHVSAVLARAQRSAIRLNLGGASCAPELYPGNALRNGALRVLRRSPQILTTATGPDGHPRFRNLLARQALAAGIRTTAEEILPTYGCTEAMNLALRAVTHPGDLVAVESPTYFGLLQALESLGLRALEIPTSPHTGISLEALDLALQTQRIAAVAVMPNLHNPLGSTMPDAHKERLVRLCETQRIPLIEDDTFGPLASADVSLTATKAWDRSGNVIYCASLNKVLAPGLRLGWMIAGRWQARVQMLKYAQSHHNEQWAQHAAAEFLAAGAYDRHLRRLRSRLDAQRERTAEAIAAHFPAGTRLSVPRGGVVLWVELPQRLSSERLFDAALAEGIRIAPGLMFSNTRRFDHFVRINCGAPYSDEIEAALRRLGALVTEMSTAGAAANDGMGR